MLIYNMTDSILHLDTARLVVLSLLILSVIALTVLLLWLRRQLRERTEQLLRSEQAFFGMVHDLKTPLAAAYADLRHLSEQESDPNKAIALEDSAERINLISDKVKRLLSLPKLLQESHASKPVKISLMGLLLPVESELEVSYPTRQITFEHLFDIEQNLTTPAGEMEALLRILLENAVKYAGTEPHITISMHDPGGQSTLIIQDNGPGLGIRPNNRLVELHLESLPTKAAGNGIGLLYAIRLCREMGAKLLCRSTESGTTMAIVLHPGKESLKSAVRHLQKRREV